MLTRRLFALVCAVVLGTGSMGSWAFGAAEDVEIDLTHLRAIQTRTPGDDKVDDAYWWVTGAANGKAYAKRLPEGGKDGAPATVKASQTASPITEKNPQSLWKGKLEEGEFVVMTITLMQGKALTEAKEKEFLAKKAAAEKDVEGLKKAKLTADDFKSLHTKLLTAHQGLAKGMKEVFSRKLKTDFYGGMFTLIVWNNGGKIVKRLDPVGLTNGEHYGLGVKTYTKIKRTRDNVLVKDEEGEWEEISLEPITDEETAVRVKMLETEEIPVPGADDPERNVTDYLMDIQVKVGGKAQKWELGGSHPGPSDTHEYWDWAF